MYRRWSIGLLLAVLVGLLAPAMGFAQTPTPAGNRPSVEPDMQEVTGTITSGTPPQLAAAMGINPAHIVGSSVLNSDTQGMGIGSTHLGANFPTAGSTFVILSTGLANIADTPNDAQGTGSTLGGQNNSQGNDLVQLKLDLAVPAGITCASFDFKYYSEEFPEYVGQAYNDTFTAELGGTQITISGASVSAPLNFAFDSQHNIISINTVYGMTSGTGTTYDGATPLLRARTPVTPGSTASFVFSVQDLGDSAFDSAVFLDNFFWATDPNCTSGSDVDTDGDGLLDSWEINGFNGVDLPAMGANPLRKDIFVEIDYMEQTCGAGASTACKESMHSHKPSQASIVNVMSSFANAPVSNPDNSTGITLHVDNGPTSPMKPDGTVWGSLSKSNAIAHATFVGSGAFIPGDTASWTAFDTAFAQPNMGAGRRSLFHYSLFAHQLTSHKDTIKFDPSGVSRDAPGSDFIISLGNAYANVDAQAVVFMHELGHNLSLQHGGKDGVLFKPNYLSVMNYLFPFGLYKNGNSGGLDYSRFNTTQVTNLNEAALVEANGLGLNAAASAYLTLYACPPEFATIPPKQAIAAAHDQIDWNCNHALTPGTVISDLNQDLATNTLTTQNDWDNLVFNGGAIGRFGAPMPPGSPVLGEELSVENLTNLARPYGMVITGARPIRVPRGATVALHTLTLRNNGINNDTYTLSAQSQSGWGLTGLPASIALAAGQSAQLNIQVAIPAAAAANTVDALAVSAQSQTWSNTKAVANATTTILPSDSDLYINAAGTADETINGIVWKADQYFSGGNIDSGAAIADIAGTTDDAMYRKTRTSSTEFGTLSYAIPAATAGMYRVRLHFAETWWGATGGGLPGNGRRVFNITLEQGAAGLTGLDLYKEVGPMAALVKEFYLPVTDGTLNLDLAATTNRPIISGIDVRYLAPIASPAPAPVRINAGSVSDETINGVVWKVDPYAGTGNTGSGSGIADITGTTDDAMYRTTRTSTTELGTLSYAIPAASAGLYRVRLHFAETWWGATGGYTGGINKRVFNINLEQGVSQLANLDIYKEVGPMAALVKEFYLPVTDGTLNLDLAATINRPIISGIELIYVGPVPTNGSTVQRLNIAGTADETINGIVWKADQYFSGGNADSGAAIADIAGTTDDAMYRKTRTSSTEFGTLSYAIPAATAGMYRVRLHFAETWWGATGGGLPGNGRRVFNITLEQGAAGLTGLDLYKEAGPMAALVKEFYVPVVDGTVNIDLSATTNRPIISGIELLYAGGLSTDQASSTRIDVAAPADTLVSTVPWKADQYFSGGNADSGAAIADITGTNDDVMYRTTRTSSTELGTLSYAIPAATAGMYRVRLHFAETWWGATGGGLPGINKRVFNINLEQGAAALTGLDIYKEAGPMAALVKEFYLPVNDGILNIDLAASVNRPTISGIEVSLIR